MKFYLKITFNFKTYLFILDIIDIFNIKIYFKYLFYLL